MSTENIVEKQSLRLGPSLPNQKEDEKLESNELPFEVLNGYPMYQQGHVIDGRYQVFERIGWDDRVGATYLAMGADHKELVIRMATEENSVVKTEAAFLCKAESENYWSNFSQVHSIVHHGDYYLLVLYFRGGPTMQQCFDFANAKLSHGSAGRFAHDVFQTLRIIHKLGFLARSIDMESFHFDAAGRHLFMADISSIKKNSSMPENANVEKVATNWAGGQLFAPMVYHDNDSVNCRDELEAWFYQWVYMVKGLPWDGLDYESVKWSKIAAVNEGKLFDGLPKQFREVYDLITKEDSSVAVSEEDYEIISDLVVSVYREVGGVTDLDDNFDFERDPEEDELPKFVLERTENAAEGSNEESKEEAKKE